MQHETHLLFETMAAVWVAVFYKQQLFLMMPARRDQDASGIIQVHIMMTVVMMMMMMMSDDIQA